MKLKSPWEVLSLLYKSNADDLNLTVHERTLLAVIITFINGENLAKDGYKAWPSTETLISRSGVRKTTIERSRTVLVEAGWISYISGKGKGSSNIYYVNVEKIVEAALKAGAKVTERPPAKNPSVVDKKPQDRNTSGLMQGTVKPVAVPKVVDNYYDEDPDCPF